MKKSRFWLLGFLVAATGFFCYAFPRTQYKSPDALSKIRIPDHFGYWQSRDVTRKLNLNDVRYNFMNGVTAREFANDLGEHFLFLVLDAGNFHHPRVCFSGSGYDIKQLKDIEAETPERRLKAKALFMDKGRESLLVVYWITINQKPVDWTTQKIDELYYSLFNKEKIGLMGRLDIPTSKESLAQAIGTAEGFLKALSRNMAPEDADYLFGK